MRVRDSHALRALRRRVADAMDPSKAPGKPIRLAEMSREKRAEMERLYGRGPRASNETGGRRFSASHRGLTGSIDLPGQRPVFSE